MAREINYQLGVLNVAMHNHENAELSYEKLFALILDLKLSIELDETHKVSIGVINLHKKFEGKLYFSGMFYKYAAIDPNRDCLNTESNDFASDEDKASISIPENLKPHFTKIPFVFIPKGHRLYVQSKHLNTNFSIRSAEKIMKKLLSHEKIVESLGVVEVTIEPSLSVVDELINNSNLTKIWLEIIRPNPDDLDDEENKVLELMDKRNLKKMNKEYISHKNEKIVLDDTLKTEIQISSFNGKVKAEEINYDGTKKTISTSESPLVESGVYLLEKNTDKSRDEIFIRSFLTRVFEIHKRFIKSWSK